MDLIDGSKFTRSDIITLQDPQNPDIMAKRDMSSFKHLRQVRQEASDAKAKESKVRHSSASENIMKEIEKKRAEEELSGVKRKTTAEILQGNDLSIEEDVERFQRCVLYPS